MLLSRSDQRLIGSNVTLPSLLFDRRRAGAVEFAAGAGEVVVMTEAVFDRCLAYRNVVGEVIVEGVVDAHLVEIGHKILAHQLFEIRCDIHGRDINKLRNLTDQNLSAVVFFNILTDAAAAAF